MKYAWLISFIRFPMLVVALFVFFLLLSLFNLDFQFPFLPEFSAIYFTIVNVLCFVLLHQILKKEGRSIKDLVGYRPKYLVKDILFGVLWLFVLFIPFMIAIMGTMFVMFGTDFVHQFEIVFAGDVDNYNYSRPLWLMWITALISLLFPFFNAPIEELMYRGYAQPKFIDHYQKVWIGVLIPSFGFALQHIMLAISYQGVIVYAVAYFVWGVCSGIIVHMQKRLFPMIICHFIINFTFSVFPIIFLLFGVNY